MFGIQQPSNELVMQVSTDQTEDRATNVSSSVSQSQKPSAAAEEELKMVHQLSDNVISSTVISVRRYRYVDSINLCLVHHRYITNG